MTQRDDWLIQELAGLSSIAPDPTWEERVRARCHAKIAQRPSRAKQAETRTAPRGHLIDAIAVVALCLYLSAVLEASARLAGLL
jgi:hypothetical protein